MAEALAAIACGVTIANTVIMAVYFNANTKRVDRIEKWLLGLFIDDHKRQDDD